MKSKKCNICDNLYINNSNAQKYCSDICKKIKNNKYYKKYRQKHKEHKKTQLLETIIKTRKIDYLYLATKLNIKMKNVFDYINEIKKGI